MDPEEYTRARIREAREKSGLSQARLAVLLNTTQASVSDIERGRVPISVGQLVQLAKMLCRPITYFFPSDLHPDTSSDETTLLDIFRQLPDRWRTRLLYEAKHVLALYERIRPYEQAGIPDEFYYMLLWQKEQDLAHEEQIEAEAEGAVTIRGDDYDFHSRFHDWLRSADQARSIDPA